MATSATAIRFADEEKAWIQACADFAGLTFSEFVRKSALEKVEDAADLQAYKDALEQDDGERYSMEEVMRMVVSAHIESLDASIPTS